MRIFIVMYAHDVSTTGNEVLAIKLNLTDAIKVVKESALASPYIEEWDAVENLIYTTYFVDTTVTEV